MKKQNILKLFNHFLKEKEVYPSFYHLIHNSKNFSIFSETLKAKRYGYLISSAFAWRNTQEGFDFWLRTSIHWQQFCEANNI